MKLYLGTGAALLGYLGLAWLAGSALHLDTSRFYLLFAILAVLGIGGAVVFIWLWSKVRPQSAGAAGATGVPSGPMTKSTRRRAMPKAAWLHPTWRRPPS